MNKGCNCKCKNNYRGRNCKNNSRYSEDLRCEMSEDPRTSGIERVEDPRFASQSQRRGNQDFEFMGREQGDRYFMCNHYYDDPNNYYSNNHFVRNNHRTTTNHRYVKDNYYVNDLYYTKDIYYYDREVVQNSYDCGTETIIDPSSEDIYRKPTPYHAQVIDTHYDECTEEEFNRLINCNAKKNKCKNHCDCNCGFR